MKKILSILGATGLVATTSATVIACGNQITLASLESIISTRNLGEIITNDKEPSALEIIAAVNEKNNFVLDEEEVKILDITNISAIIAAKTNSTKYSGKVELSFTTNTTNLEYLVTNTHLNEVGNNDGATTTEIIDAVNKRNGFNLVEEEVEVKNITRTSAEIVAKSGSKIYTNGVKVHYIPNLDGTKWSRTVGAMPIKVQKLNDDGTVSARVTIIYHEYIIDITVLSDNKDGKLFARLDLNENRTFFLDAENYLKFLKDDGKWIFRGQEIK